MIWDFWKNIGSEDLRIIRWLLAAFSLYSRIPVPGFKGSRDDYAHSLSFFPLVGAVIGALVYVLNSALLEGIIPVAVRIILTILCPIIVTGGFHLDGFMDTEDALNSFGKPEKKLEILKDPHIGAFAVIGLVKWLLIYAAAVTAILISGFGRDVLIHFCLSFVISRCLSGLTSLCFEKAKKEGMLYEETGRDRKVLSAFLIVQLAVSCICLLLRGPLYACLEMVSFVLYTFYYRQKTKTEFGGVTGDTAGFFVTTAEIISGVVLAISVLIRGAVL